MKRYRRIEVNAYRRRVTVVSGEWPPSDVFDPLTSQTDDEVSLNDSDACEPVEPDSPEGQLLLVEAVRSLERRLSPEARALSCAGQNALASVKLGTLLCQNDLLHTDAGRHVFFHGAFSRWVPAGRREG